MLKAIFTLILSMAVFNNCFSQETLIDKNKVLDFFQNQQFEEALEYLGPIYATQPDNIQVMNYLGYAQYMLDDYREAKKIYQQIFSIDSNNISANQYLAIITYNQDADECLSFYQRLHNLEPSKAVHCRHIGELWSRKNNSDSALYYFQKAYYMTPKDYRNAVGFAGALLDEKQYNRTDSILEAGLKLDSLNGSYLRLRVRSAYEAGDYKNAIAPGETLLKLKENSTNTISQIILSYYNLKLYSECIRVADYTIAEEIVSESIYYYQAKSYAKLLDYEKSNQLLRQCLSTAISKSAELYFYTLGENYEALKKYKTAIAQYDTGFYLFRNPVLLYNCGRIYESDLKNTTRGKNYYKRYLLYAKPDNPDEKKAYDYVRKRMNTLK